MTKGAKLWMGEQIVCMIFIHSRSKKTPIAIEVNQFRLMRN